MNCHNINQLCVSLACSLSRQTLLNQSNQVTSDVPFNSSPVWLGASMMPEQLIGAAMELHLEHFPPAEPDVNSNQMGQSAKQAQAGFGKRCCLHKHDTYKLLVPFTGL